MRRILVAMVVAVVLLGIWFSIPSEWGLPPERKSPIIRWIAIPSVVGVLALPVVSSVFNWKILGFVRKFEVWMSRSLEQKYLNEAGLESRTMATQKPGEKPNRPGEYEEVSPRGRRVPKPRRVTIGPGDTLPPTQNPGRKWKRTGPPKP